MTNKIQNGELYVTENGARIRTRCDKRYVDDDAIARMAYNARLGAGDSIVVQCVDFRGEQVFWQRRYLVVAKQSYLKQTENYRGDIHQADDFKMTVVPEGDWFQGVRQLRVKFISNAYKFGVYDPEDNLLAKNLDEETANKMASNEIPLPEPSSKEAPAGEKAA